jgi:hypothetical protein
MFVELQEVWTILNNKFELLGAQQTYCTILIWDILFIFGEEKKSWNP